MYFAMIYISIETSPNACIGRPCTGNVQAHTLPEWVWLHAHNDLYPTCSNCYEGSIVGLQVSNGRISRQFFLLSASACLHKKRPSHCSLAHKPSIIDCQALATVALKLLPIVEIEARRPILPTPQLLRGKFTLVCIIAFRFDSAIERSIGLIIIMQMIFNNLSGSSGPVPVTPVGGNKLYCALWEQRALGSYRKQR